MDHGFLKDWDTESREPVISKVGAHFHHRTSTKEQVSSALYRLKTQQNKLESAAVRMQQHDKEIFNKCVSSQLAHDTARAAMYRERVRRSAQDGESDFTMPNGA